VAEFEVVASLGEEMYDGMGPYDVVTIMFAIHYFYESEHTLRMLVRNAAQNLKPGVCALPLGRALFGYTVPGTGS
jgi:hypothetical protein